MTVLLYDGSFAQKLIFRAIHTALCINKALSVARGKLHSAENNFCASEPPYDASLLIRVAAVSPHGDGG
jgi:hypothetical protein